MCHRGPRGQIACMTDSCRAGLLLCSVGIELPAVEVRFQNLHVETSHYTESGRNLPTILNAYRGALEVTTRRLAMPCCATMSMSQLGVGLPWRRVVSKQSAQPALATVLTHSAGFSIQMITIRQACFAAFRATLWLPFHSMHSSRRASCGRKSAPWRC